jgi:predicted nucleic acid-binding Zn ribbon protein
MNEAPLEQCPKCHGEVRRIVSGGSGFILKGSGQGRVGKSGAGCSLENSGKTCCGRSQRCDKPPCGDK